MNGRVLICAATRIEARACRSGIENAHAADRFEVLQTGIGLRAAEAALRRHVDGRGSVKAKAIVSSGFAGAKSSSIELGTWVVASAVTRAGAAELPTAGRVAELLARAPLRWSQARCLSREAVSHAGEALPDGGALQVVDMESFALAQIAHELQIPFDVLRLISDTPAQPIPEAVGTFTAVATAEGTAERARRLWSGSLQALASPSAMVGFVTRSISLPTQLAQGWEVLARAWNP